MVFHDFRGNIWRRSLMLLKYVVGVKYVLIRTTLTRFIMGAAIFNTSSWHLVMIVTWENIYSFAWLENRSQFQWLLGFNDDFFNSKLLVSLISGPHLINDHRGFSLKQVLWTATLNRYLHTEVIKMCLPADTTLVKSCWQSATQVIG